MKQIPHIKSVMTPFPHSVESTETIARAAELMAGHAIQHLPVTEQGRLIGVLGDRELRAALREDEQSGRKEPRQVRETTISESYVVELTEPLDVVLLRMAEKKVESALVVKDKRLVGIFTRTDACRCFAELLRSLFPRDHDDDAA
jgi:acetoin utilization protein AcuB